MASAEVQADLKAAGAPDGDTLQAQGQASAGEAIATGHVTTEQAASMVCGAVALAGFPEVAEAMYVAFQVGKAISGPIQDLLGLRSSHESYCAAHNPSGPNDPAWVHWQDVHGAYPAPTPGSFEAFAFPVLALNDELWMNCKPNAKPSELLRFLVDAWNTNHTAPTQTLVAKPGAMVLKVGPFGSTVIAPNTGADLLLFTLGKVQSDVAADPSSALSRSFAPDGDPQNVSVQINRGEMIARVAPGLRQGPATMLGGKAAAGGIGAAWTGPATMLGGKAAAGGIGAAWTQQKAPPVTALRDLGIVLHAAPPVVTSIGAAPPTPAATTTGGCSLAPPHGGHAPAFAAVLVVAAGLLRRFRSEARAHRVERERLGRGDLA